MTAVVEIEKLYPVIKPKRFRVADFQKMTEAGILPEESGWEIIDGYLIDKMSSGSRHAGIVRKLSKLLERKFGVSMLISSQNPIYLDEMNQPEPDIALLVPREDFYADAHPKPKEVLLVIEVSDSTLNFDREIKRKLYAEAAIAEFWLINLREDTIECYSQPQNGSYRLAKIFGKGETISAVSIENLLVAVDDILIGQ